MRRIVVLGLATALLAGCGGGTKEKSAAPPAPKSKSNGGVVAAEPSRGILAPAVTVDQSGTKTFGKQSPISPKADRPTDAQSRGVAAGVACQSTAASPAPSNLAAMNNAILCLLNAERAAKGLPTLRANGALAKAAKVWSNKMVAARLFSHELGASTPLTRIKRTGYLRGRWSIGENLAWGSGALATPRAIVNGWMNSAPHRANILTASFRDIGIGIALGAPGTTVSGGATYVTEFGKRS